MDYFKTLPVSPTTKYYNGNSTRSYNTVQKEFMRSRVAIGDIILINKDGLWGIYNSSGRELFPPIIDYITCEFSDGLIVGRVHKHKERMGSPNKNRYVYFNQYGHKVLDSSDHAIMGEFLNGLALVDDEERQSAYYGELEFKHYRYFIDRDGNQVTDVMEMDKSIDYSKVSAIFRAKDYISYKDYREYDKRKVKQLSLKI